MAKFQKSRARGPMVEGPLHLSWSEAAGVQYYAASVFIEDENGDRHGTVRMNFNDEEARRIACFIARMMTQPRDKWGNVKGGKIDAYEALVKLAELVRAETLLKGEANADAAS